MNVEQLLFESIGGGIVLLIFWFIKNAIAAQKIKIDNLHKEIKDASAKILSLDHKLSERITILEGRIGRVETEYSYIREGIGELKILISEQSKLISAQPKEIYSDIMASLKMFKIIS